MARRKAKKLPTDKQLALMKNADLPLVKVHWRDANAQRSWKTPRDARNEAKLELVWTVGWLLKRGPDVVVVACEWSGGKVGLIHTVPTVNVDKIEMIPEP